MSAHPHLYLLSHPYGCPFCRRPVNKLQDRLGSLSREHNAMINIKTFLPLDTALIPLANASLLYVVKDHIPGSSPLVTIAPTSDETQTTTLTLAQILAEYRRADGTPWEPT